MKPEDSGFQFFNYKQFFSIVVMALVDANYGFTVIDVGHYGRSSDSNIFRQSTLHKLVYSGQLNIPDSTSLPNF